MQYKLEELLSMENLQLAEKNRQYAELIKKLAWDDFYIFTKYVIEKDLLEEHPHKEVCEFLTLGIEKSPLLNLRCTPPVTQDYVKTLEGKFKKLLMLPRGSFKSTIASTAFPIWLLWHNPNLRIMMDCSTLGNAKKYLAAIKDLMENGRMLRQVCTDDSGKYILSYNPKITGSWTEDQIILNTRTKLGMKEPSIFLSAVDHTVTGMHPDVIIMDDLVSEDTVKTDTQLDKTKEHYRFSLSLLEPGGLQVVIGTRYHMNDLYAELLEFPTFNKLVRPAVLEDGSLYFPTRLGHARLAELRMEQGSYIFSSQYMLTPIDGENATFRKALIRYYDTGGMKLPPLVARYIMVDLAISQEKRADYTVVIAVGMDRDKRLYVLEYDRGKYTPKETVEAIFRMYRKQKDYGFVRSVGIETVQYQKSMIYMVQDEMRRTGCYMPVCELKPGREKKEDRIRTALEPIFSSGSIFISSMHTELENELLQFPYSQHDDIIDPLAYITQLLQPGNVGRKQQVTEFYKPGNSMTNY